MLQLARQNVLEAFERLPERVFRQREIERLFVQNREEWGILDNTNGRDFIEFLIRRGKLKRLEFPFPYRKETRFTWGDVPLQEILLTLKPDCHFSHYTAVQMHDLTEQDSKTIYLNVEQPAKPQPSGELRQDRIDSAFARKPRVTSNIAPFGDWRICLVNGKSTGYLGVETRETGLPGEGGKYVARVTDLERTLIDITVRPFYAGGVAEVQKAYTRAASRASVNRLAALLQKLDYVYPYHQAVGFYLCRSGAFKTSAIELFRGKFRYEFDFYLTYEMKETQYDSRWRLHVPKGF